MVTAHQVQPIILTLILMLAVAVSSVASRRVSFEVTLDTTPVVQRPAYRQTGSAVNSIARYPEVNPVVAVPSHLHSPFAS